MNTYKGGVPCPHWSYSASSFFFLKEGILLTWIVLIIMTIALF